MKRKAPNTKPQIPNAGRTPAPTGPSTLNPQPSTAAEQLRDLRVALLVHLYRVQPLGRTAARLHRLIQLEIPCAVTDVNAQLGFLRGKNFVEEKSADEIAPGLDPFWFITSAGMSHCEERRLV